MKKLGRNDFFSSNLASDFSSFILGHPDLFIEGERETFYL